MANKLIRAFTIGTKFMAWALDNYSSECAEPIISFFKLYGLDISQIIKNQDCNDSNLKYIENKIPPDEANFLHLGWLVATMANFKVFEVYPTIQDRLDLVLRGFLESLQFSIKEKNHIIASLNSLKEGNRDNNISALFEYIREQIRNHFSDDNFNKTTIIMGDNYQNINNSNFIKESILVDAFNKISIAHNRETGASLKRMAEIVEKSGNAEAAELFNSLNEELVKSAPKKASLKSFWQSLIGLLPSIDTTVGIAEHITKLFS